MVIADAFFLAVRQHYHPGWLLFDLEDAAHNTLAARTVTQDQVEQDGYAAVGRTDVRYLRIAFVAWIDIFWPESAVVAQIPARTLRSRNTDDDLAPVADLSAAVGLECDRPQSGAVRCPAPTKHSSTPF